MASYRTLDDVGDCAGKRVLVRVDFNVPMDETRRVSDGTRIERAAPTIRTLSEKGAKVILLSHFGRPKGDPRPDMSLQPVSVAAARVLDARVAFAPDCVGDIAAEAIARLGDGDIILMENTRFHAAEESNDADFAAALAATGDLFVNDAFSAAHRAHASTEGVTRHLPAFAGRAMEKELTYLEAALAHPKRPMMAVVGGAKVSSKIELLLNLITKADMLVVGGGMANTFLFAQGHSVGKSLCEPTLSDTAREILAQASAAKCEIILPVDAVVAGAFKADAPSRTVAIDAIEADDMVLDLGPDSVDRIAAKMATARTLVWNGPLGAFEIRPFDTATVEAARFAAGLVGKGTLTAVAGGGDTVAALNHARVADEFTYLSTAGGAFLEWLEGKTLPGVKALEY
ncbi:MAG: phosphoglycerate kinase [Pseudomonadota bacterium]